jgi:shikimate kinase
MARALHVRLDTDSEAALGTLRAEGLNDSQAVRLALVEARSRRRQRAALREEAARLAGDAGDRAELAAIGADLDVLTPAWAEE